MYLLMKKTLPGKNAKKSQGHFLKGEHLKDFTEGKLNWNSSKHYPCTVPWPYWKLIVWIIQIWTGF